MFLFDLEIGASVFIDANIFIYHFSQESRFNASCSQFLGYIENQAIKGYTFTFVIQEVIHRMMIMEALVFYPGIKPKDIIKHLKKNKEITKKLISHQNIAHQLKFFNLEIISPDIESIIRSQQMKKKIWFSFK